jgi:hypothetical protein
MTDLILAGLLKRRAELLKEAKAAETTYHRLMADVAHLDGAARVYDPTYHPRKVSIRVRSSRGVLAILRGARAPMSVREIVVAGLSAQGKDTQDAKLVLDMIKRVRSPLSRYRTAGTVRSVPGPGQTLLWEVVR